jgi:hypothetical protein
MCQFVEGTVRSAKGTSKRIVWPEASAPFRRVREWLQSWVHALGVLGGSMALPSAVRTPRACLGIPYFFGLPPTAAVRKVYDEVHGFPGFPHGMVMFAGAF